MNDIQMVEITKLALPLLFIPMCIGLLWLMLLLVFAKTKTKETLILTIILFVLFCLSFQTFQSINEEKLLFYSNPYHIGTLVTLGTFLSLRLLLFTKLDWKSLLPEMGLILVGSLILSLPEVAAGTIFSLLLICFGGYRIWDNYYSNFPSWPFVNYVLFTLLGLFGLIGLWIPFDGGRFLYAFFLLSILIVTQLHFLDFVMDRLKTASVSSITDPLTGLYNKGFLLKKAEQIASEQELSVIFADIDNFKILNDTKGHDHGDLILKDSSKILQSVLGVNGFACRFGGEELVGLITKGDAETKAEKFRTLIEKRLGVTVSVGVASGSSSGSAIIKEADLAMYEAKNSGKNRVVVYGQAALDLSVGQTSGGGIENEAVKGSMEASKDPASNQKGDPSGNDSNYA